MKENSTFDFVPFDYGNELTITKRNLPHWEQDGVTYFITFRLIDSVPIKKLNQWKMERELWLKRHKPPFSDNDWKEYNSIFTERVQNWLDKGNGKCYLRDSEVSKIIEDALKFFEGKRYNLHEWVIMPNHVHVLVTPIDDHSIKKINHSWKSFTGNEINKQLVLKGTFWQDESYDHIVRSKKQFGALRKYIFSNPQKAGLTKGFRCSEM